MIFASGQPASFIHLGGVILGGGKGWGGGVEHVTRGAEPCIVTSGGVRERTREARNLDFIYLVLRPAIFSFAAPNSKCRGSLPFHASRVIV